MSKSVVWDTALEAIGNENGLYFVETIGPHTWSAFCSGKMYDWERRCSFMIAMDLRIDVELVEAEANISTSPWILVL